MTFRKATQRLQNSASATTTTTADPASGTGDGRFSDDGLPVAWSLTVLYHIDARLIGARACWPATPGSQISLSRHEPLFVLPRGGTAQSLGLSQISRTPLQLRCTPQGLTLSCESDRVRYELNDRPGMSQEWLPLKQLQRGIHLSLGQGVVLHLRACSASQGEGGSDRDILGVSEDIFRLRAEIERLSKSDMPILIIGETGTGKELVARALHACSPRSARKLVAVNMAALPASTAMAELFGHARGAFTGASEARPGLFREAGGGTIFLDEIGETPLEIQPMLLRTLESREIQPLGLPPQQVDVRIIAATDADLQKMVDSGHFKRPLLFRLATAILRIPPLREHTADIPLLFVHFLREALEELGAAHLLAAPEGQHPWLRRTTVLSLLRYPWPGNVRELKSVAYQTAGGSLQEPRARLPSWLTEKLEEIETLSASGFGTEQTLRRRLELESGVGAGFERPVLSGQAHRQPEGGEGVGEHGEQRSPGAPVRLAEIDEHTLRVALEACDWQIGPASSRLGISRRSTYVVMEKYGIRLAGSLSGEEILAASAQVGMLDPERIAALLTVSPRGLRLRMRALGLLS